MNVKILNIDFLPITQNDLLKQIDKGVLITPNVDHLVKLQHDREFYDVYQKAEWVVCDSKILYILSKLLRHPLPEAIPGSSFFTAYYSYHKELLTQNVLVVTRRIQELYLLHKRRILQLKCILQYIELRKLLI